MVRATPHRPGRGIVAALASAVVPGSGQLLAGERRKGWALVGVTVVVAAVVGWMLLAERHTLLRWSVQPRALQWLLFGDFALLLFRVYASVDAYFSAAPIERGPRGSLGIATAVLLGLTTAAALAVPHIVAGYYDVVQYDLITTVFAPSTTLPPPTTTTTTTTNGQEPAGTTTTTTTTTTLPPPRLWDGRERLNVLLLGGDAGIGRTGVRTDTIIVASIDPASGDTALIAVPRNMARVPLPDGLDIWSCDCFPPIINELWKYGEEHPDRFPGAGPPGAEALKMAIGEMLELDIHYYALVNLDGFISVIDALGGVDITVTERIYDAEYPDEDGTLGVLDIAPGEYHMDGHLALAYARSRHATDDYDRMGRQRCVLQAVADQASPADLIRSFPTLAQAIKDNVSTDIPLERLPDLVDLLATMDTENMVALPLVPPRFTGPRTSDGYNTPDLPVIRDAAQIVTTLPPDEAIAALDLEPLADACAVPAKPPWQQ
ncbi:MAG: LCP family protein [Acidimicrobiia bacterium]|jgi:LCP family protein required for cell wall assembly